VKPERPAKEALVVLARYPGEGAVKKRLEKDLGASKTLRLYRAFLDDLAEKFGTGSRPLFWFYTPAESPFAELFRGRFACRPQCGAGLAERQLHVFETLFRDGFHRVVVIGTDVPHIPVEAVDEAFASLNARDVVFRPSFDGGYHLVGLKAAWDLFRGIAMSTDRVFRETLERAVSMGLSIHCLAPSFDIDTIQDVKRLRKFLAETNDALPHTREALTEILLRPPSV
jgi:rSAM/selenodomain-associated transferase 1